MTRAGAVLAGGGGGGGGGPRAGRPAASEVARQQPGRSAAGRTQTTGIRLQPAQPVSMRQRERTTFNVVFHLDVALNYRRRIKYEEKAKVVSGVWGTELMQQLAR